MVGMLLLFMGAFLYLVPALVAAYRSHPNLTAIGVLNVLLGWTFVGWVVALVWASTAVDNKRRAIR